MYGCPQADSLTGQGTTGQGTGLCPAEDTEVSKRTVLGKQQLFTRCKFKEEFIKLKQVP